MKIELLLVSFIGVVSALKLNGTSTSNTTPRFLDLFPKTNKSSCFEWEGRVHQCYTGCKNVLDNFSGVAFDMGKTVIGSFKSLTDRAVFYTGSNSSFISSRSIAVLEAISVLDKLGKSPSYLLYQFHKALPHMSMKFRGITTNLSDAIGELNRPVNKAISACETSMTDLLKYFQNRLVNQNQNQNRIEIYIKSCLKSARYLTNTIALIADTALNNCDSFTIHNDVFEAICIIIWTSLHYILSIQGTIANIGTVLDAETTDLSDSLDLCLQSMDPIIDGIGDAVAYMTLDVQKSCRELSAKWVELTPALNEAMESELGAFTGTKITVSQIIKNLKRS